MPNMTVAEAIAQQIGCGLAMIGATDLVSTSNSLQFKIDRGAKNGITHISITLNKNDLYDIKVMKYFPRKLEMKIIDTYSDVFSYSLKYVIGQATGFNMSL